VTRTPAKKEKKIRQTFEKMEGFSFVTPVTSFNRPNTVKEDDDDDILHRQIYEQAMRLATMKTLSVTDLVGLVNPGCCSCSFRWGESMSLNCGH
jgi:hypothetical protein